MIIAHRLAGSAYHQLRLEENLPVLVGRTRVDLLEKQFGGGPARRATSLMFADAAIAV